MPTLKIVDSTGSREIFDPVDISGELWYDGEYCGQFILHAGEMLLINKGGKIETYIPHWSWVGWHVGRG